jgi:hypothetical protein
MTEREQVEYSALRATIRERGTARVYIFAGGVAAWGALTAASAALASTPLATLLPLVVLACVFEAVFALHIGVERVGRYLQVFHEAEPATPEHAQTGAPAAPPTPRSAPPRGASGWEHVAMAFGRPSGGAALDPLFSVPFLVAALVNLGPALVLEPTRVELVFVGGAHALFAVRLAAARAAATRQRAVDLERFAQLKRDVI